MMRYVLLTAFVIGHVMLANAQLVPMPTAGWWQSTHPMSTGEVIDALSEHHTLSSDYTFEQIDKSVDPLGHTHTTFQQFFQAIPVEGAYVHIHANTENIVSVKAHIFNNIKPLTASFITSQNAIDAALSAQPAVQYAWEDQAAEQLLQRATGKTWASHYPSPELFIKHADASKQPQLVYGVEVFSLIPLQKVYYYIDAITGDVIDQYNSLCATQVTGTAHTRYHGVQSFTTDSVGPEQYRLRDYSRGQGIETYNMQEGGFISQAVDFMDKDNIWDTVNAQQNEVAHDVHWGAQQAYDYYLSTHGLNSYDGQGSPIVSYVHFGIDYVNAFWSGSWMAYGNADSGVGYYPLTTIDVVAHELTHGVTRSSSNLIYRNESGALNESFSDIFGKAVEWYADSANFSWRVARQALANGQGIRSMANPNLLGDPHTYKGNFWESGSFDNGGVHINSGVQNKWFQLLVDGGTHRNDNGDTVFVPAIGWDAATAIAYRNNSVYLSRFSQYTDARMGSLLSAADLYGQCSPEYQAVSLAWDAVGVGTPSVEQDIQLIGITVNSGCALTDQETIQIDVYNNSCTYALPAGTTLPVSLFLNALFAGQENYTLTTDLLPNTRQTWALSTVPLDLSAEKEHTITAAIAYANDPVSNNDTFTVTTNHLRQQNWNVGVDRILGPTPACFMQDEPVQLRIRFNGCDSLAAGSRIPVEIKQNSQVAFIDTLVLPNTLFPNQTVDLSTNQTIDCSDFTEYVVEARTLYPGDSLAGNDAADPYAFRTPYTYNYGQRMQFVNFTRPLDSILLTTGFRAEANLSVFAGNGVGLGLQLSGTNVNPRPRYDFPDSTNVWAVNSSSSASACWCVDATQSPTMAVTFDLKQTRADVHQILAGQDLPYSSPFRVTVNGQQVSPTYLPKSYNSDDWITHTILLDSLAGERLEVCVEARALSNRAGDVTGATGDNAYVDNVFFGVPDVSTNTMDVSSATAIRLYPNPANTVAYLDADRTLQDVTIQVHDMTGRVVSRQMAAEWQQGNIDLALLPGGTYWVQLTHIDGQVTLPLVVTK